MILGQRSVALDLLQQSLSINQTLADLTTVILHIEFIGTVLQRQILIFAIFQIAIDVARSLDQILLQRLSRHLHTQLRSIRQTQCRYTRYVRASHRGTTHQSITIDDGAQNLSCRVTITATYVRVFLITEVGVTTRSRNINPSTVAAIICGTVVCTDRSNRNNTRICRRILRSCTLIVTLVTCRKHNQTTCHRANLNLTRLVHTCIINEVADSGFERRELRIVPVNNIRITPAVLADYRAIVTSVGNCTRCIVGTTTTTLVVHRCTAHQSYAIVCARATCDTRNTLAVVVHRCDRTCYVSTVVGTISSRRIIHRAETLVRVEVETKDIVNITVLVVILTLNAIFLGIVVPDVACQILVIVIDNTIDYRYNNLARTRTLLPRGNDIYVSTLNCALDIGRTVSLLPIGTTVLVVPLLNQTGIVERQLLVSHNLLGCCHHIGLGHLHVGQFDGHIELNDRQILVVRQHLANLRHRNALVERDLIPQMQTSLALTSLKTTRSGEQTLDVVCTNRLTERVDRLNTGRHLTLVHQHRSRLNGLDSRLAELHDNLTCNGLLCTEHHLGLLRQHLRRHRTVDVHRVVDLRINTRRQHCCCAHQE